MGNGETNKLNIVVAGFIVGGPLGGLVWHHLQYVLGLRALGHRVLFVEDSDDYPSCYDPQINEVTDDPSYGLSFVQAVFAKYGLQDSWAYFHQPGNRWFGAGEKRVKDFIRAADIFLNLSGVNPVRDYFLRIPVRVFVDTDPVFTQVRHLTEPSARERAAAHNRFFTYGENFGKPGCTIPADGFHWQPTRQPVVLDEWPYTAGNGSGSWTTVMQWDSYKARTYEGRTFGMKSASFNDYFSLPQKTEEVFELAVGSATAPREKLRAAGWKLADPLAVTLSAETYQDFLRQSKGEWSVAKQGYVISHSGWFSERTSGYLASGRPCVVQDTGFSVFLETGRGVFAFSSPEEVLEGIHEINGCYKKHCNWAREAAEEYFRADKVLAALLEQCNRSVAATRT